MYTYAKYTTPYVLDTLSKFSSGVVHSVYRSTINLSMSGNLITLQAENSVLSPIGLITPWKKHEMDCLDVRVEDSVHYNDCTLQINDSLFISIKDTKIQSPILTSIECTDSLLALNSNILSSLLLKDTGGLNHLLINPRDDSLLPFLKVAQIRIHNCEKCLSLGDWQSAADSICKLVGLGIGLTPCGDDFLCGVLAGLTLCNLWTHPFSCFLRASLARQLSGTNEISAAFLRRALENQFSSPILSLSHLPTSQEIFDLFIKIGHSSGMDTLCGILFILQNHFLFDPTIKNKEPST